MQKNIFCECLFFKSSDSSFGYNNKYGWGSGSSPQNMYFPNHSSGASEAAAVNNIAKTGNFNFSSSQGNYMDALIYNTMTKTTVLAFNQYHVVSSIGPLGPSYYGSDGGIYFANSTAGFERNMGNFFDGGSTTRSFSGGLFSDGVWALGFTGTLSAGIIGGSFELGLTMDFRHGFNFGAYGTLEHAVGADLSLGGVLNYYKPTNRTTNFSINNLEGWGESSNGGAWIIDGTYGGNALNTGLNFKDHSRFHSSYNTYGFGLSAGLPVGYSRNKGYTWTSSTIKIW